MPERKVDYQVLQQKADSGFQITAPSWQRLYIDAALALTDQLARLDGIQPKEKRQLTASGASKEELMVAWLSEILTLFDREHFVAKRVVFDTFDGKRIAATVHGEHYDAIRHGGGAEIKGVSPKMQLGERADLFFARVILEW